jgi:hypothetical protein
MWCSGHAPEELSLGASHDGDRDLAAQPKKSSPSEELLATGTEWPLNCALGASSRTRALKAPQR